jgi:hypothetical protein
MKMKKVLLLTGLLVIPFLCFAVDYYAEYSFDETREISIAEIHGGNGWKYNFVFHWTKTDVQNRINSDRQIKDSSSGTSFAFRRTASDLMSRMLRASADKRIFVIDTSVEFGRMGGCLLR